MNVNTIFPPEDELSQIATSLAELAGDQLDMRAIYRELLVSLDQWYEAWKQSLFQEIYKAWKDVQLFLGKPITIHQKDGSVISGIVNQVLPNGDLMLKTEKNILTIPFYTVEEVKIDITTKG